jgi:hypothetical protein
MYTFEAFIIAVYCAVDEALKVLTSGHRLRGRGFTPGLSDAAVIATNFISSSPSNWTSYPTASSARRICYSF